MIVEVDTRPLHKYADYIAEQFMAASDPLAKREILKSFIELCCKLITPYSTESLTRILMDSVHLCGIQSGIAIDLVENKIPDEYLGQAMEYLHAQLVDAVEAQNPFMVEIMDVRGLFSQAESEGGLLSLKYDVFSGMIKAYILPVEANPTSLFN